MLLGTNEGCPAECGVALGYVDGPDLAGKVIYITEQPFMNALKMGEVEGASYRLNCEFHHSDVADLGLCRLQFLGIGDTRPIGQNTIGIRKLFVHGPYTAILTKVLLYQLIRGCLAREQLPTVSYYSLGYPKPLHASVEQSSLHYHVTLGW